MRDRPVQNLPQNSPEEPPVRSTSPPGNHFVPVLASAGVKGDRASLFLNYSGGTSFGLNLFLRVPELKTRNPLPASRGRLALREASRRRRRRSSTVRVALREHFARP
jgi:hypothetical protein